MSKNLVEILEENDIRLIKRGERWVARCPFHEGDRDPSFTIYPDMSYWCFGCKRGGDAITFLTDYRGMPYALALEYAGIERRGRPVKHVIKVKNTSATYPFLYGVADVYHQNLLKTAGAFQYVLSRGLTLETIEKYKVGYTDGGVIDPQFAEEFQQAVEANVITMTDKGDWWETMSHRITIPHIIAPGLCDFIMGRTVSKDRIKYLGLRIPKPLYGLSSAFNESVLYLVEGHFDWLLLKQWGWPAICAGGTNIPKYNQLPLKSRFVVIVPDNDDEGMKAARKLHEQLGTTNSFILDYAYLGVKDVGELGLMENGKELFSEAVEKSWQQNLLAMTLEELSPHSATPIPFLST